MRTKQTNIVLPEELKERIRAAAKKLGMSIATYVRVAVCEKLAREKGASDDRT
jgi:predicted DNA-binding protein